MFKSMFSIAGVTVLAYVVFAPIGFLLISSSISNGSDFNASWGALTFWGVLSLPWVLIPLMLIIAKIREYREDKKNLKKIEYLGFYY